MEQQRSDAEGRFKFDAVQPGRYQVSVNTGASHTKAVTVGADEPPAEVVIVLPRKRAEPGERVGALVEGV